MSFTNSSPQPLVVATSREIKIDINAPVAEAAAVGAAEEPDMRSPNKPKLGVVSPPKMPLTPDTPDLESGLDNWDNTSEKDDTAECCLYCGGAVVAFSVLIGLCVLTGYNIYALSMQSNKTIHRHCRSSYLWEWMISWICVNAYLSMVLKNSKGDDFSERMAGFLCQSIVAIGLLIWGAVECWGIDCVDTSLLLYTLSEVTICFNIALLTLIYIGSIFVMCKVSNIE